MNIDCLAREGVVDAEDSDLFWYAETAQEIWDGIQNWKRASAEHYGALSLEGAGCDAAPEEDR